MNKTDQIVMRKVASLVPYVRNPRRNDGFVSQMVASIKEFGFKIPVLIKSDGEVIDGHLRLKAAQRLGIAEVPVILCDEWSEAQVKAFRLLVNRSVTWAEWDPELLKLELADLQEFKFDLALTGFDQAELDALLQSEGTTGLTDEDEVPETPDEPVSRTGDLWILGKHRLICGDSTDPAVVNRLFNGIEPVLMVCDPPYGINYDPAWRKREWVGARATGTVANDDQADWREAYALFPGDVVYIWHAGNKADVVAASLYACGFEIRTQIVWAKQHFVISRGHYHGQHEPCWYAVRKGATGHWAGDRKQTTLWQIANRNAFGGSHDDSSTVHGTQKPVECMRRPILNHTNVGQAVYDQFMGSGTTLIAAESTGRCSYGIDIDPSYIDVAVSRWQAFNGRPATLDGDGRTFKEIADERHGRT